MKKKIDTKMLVAAGLLIALHIILSRFCSVTAWNIKFGFAFAPLYVAAYLYGPWFAGIVGALADFLGAILFPIGAYFPGFTLTGFLTGILFGVFLHKKQTPVRILGAVAIDQLVLSLLLNTLWISILYGSPYLPLMATRAVQCLIMTPVMYLTISAVTKILAGSKRSLI